MSRSFISCPNSNHTLSHLFCAKETTDTGHPQTFFVVPLTGFFKQKSSEYFKLTRNGSHSNRQSFKFQETKMSVKALNLGPLWWWGPIPIYKWWRHYRVCFHLIWAIGTSALERRSEVITESNPEVPWHLHPETAYTKGCYHHSFQCCHPHPDKTPGYRFQSSFFKTWSCHGSAENTPAF